MFINQLYEKYRAELASLLQEDVLTFEQFEAAFGERLNKMNRAVIDDSAGQGVMHYFTYEESCRVCVIPAYGCWASSERVLMQLITQISAALVAEKDTLFQVHLYAGDLQAQKTFAMLQFGYMAETGIMKKELAMCSHQKALIRTLSKEEINNKWDEIWSLTGAILNHLQQAPVFYPCEEFTEEIYRDFFLDEETKLHAAFDASGRMIGMIETNAETNAMIGAQLANVGEIYVIPEYRGTGLSDALLAYAQSFTRMQGAKYLWVEHGTANPNARHFWGKYFDSCEYEMNRTIRQISQNGRG